MSFVIAYDTEEEAEIIRPPNGHVIEILELPPAVEVDEQVVTQIVDKVLQDILKTADIVPKPEKKDDDTKKKEKKETWRPTPGERPKTERFKR